MNERENGYQGWANYETWCVKLWIDNDQGAQLMALEMAGAARDKANEERSDFLTPEEDAENLLANAVREWIEEQNPLADSASMWSDLMTTSLGRVDWREIAENLLEEF